MFSMAISTIKRSEAAKAYDMVIPSSTVATDLETLKYIINSVRNEMVSGDSRHISFVREAWDYGYATVYRVPSGALLCGTFFFPLGAMHYYSFFYNINENTLTMKQISIFNPSYSGTVNLTSLFSSYSYFEYTNCFIARKENVVTFSFAAHIKSTHTSESNIEITNAIPAGYRPNVASAYGLLIARLTPVLTAPIYIEANTGKLIIDNFSMPDRWVGATITYVVVE